MGVIHIICSQNLNLTQGLAHSWNLVNGGVFFSCPGVLKRLQSSLPLLVLSPFLPVPSQLANSTQQKSQGADFFWENYMNHKKSHFFYLKNVFQIQFTFNVILY